MSTNAASAIWKGRESCAIPPSFGICPAEVERRERAWTLLAFAATSAVLLRKSSEVVLTAQHGVHDRARRDRPLTAALHVPENRLLSPDDRHVVRAESVGMPELALK